MQFSVLLSLASLGLNILPVHSVAVPAAGLERYAENSADHVARSDTAEKRHVYGVAGDEIPANTRSEKRHVYGVAGDEIPADTRSEKRHVYGVAGDEIPAE